MITKQDILDRAAEWQLRPEVVEKDYVLGWLLWGLGNHPEVSEHWVFKGGTCLKKCYFETYRFSEDLDFSLQPDADYTGVGILAVLRAVAETVSRHSGITVPSDEVVVEERRDQQGRPTFRGRVRYRGPLVFPGPLRRILFDLTAHEKILCASVQAQIFHPYPDKLPAPAAVSSYSIEEVLAEKTRALFERTRPRDLYDVVYVINNLGTGADLQQTRNVFQGKCRAKGLTPPTLTGLCDQIRSSDELRADWEHMLRHQLPELPPIDGVLAETERVLTWIEFTPPAQVPSLPSASTSPVERNVASSGIRYWGRGSALEALRFAGANRLLVRFTYHGSARLAEPYSLRQTATGNLLLYAWEIGSTHIKAFNTAEIHDLRFTETRFTPRYRVELVTGGLLSSTPTAVPIRTQTPPSSTRKAARPKTSGTVYIIACPVCSKEFRRLRNDTKLRKHKAPGGWDCSSRSGFLARMA